MTKASSGARAPWGRGIVEVRQVASRVYGIRVAKHLVSRVKKIQGLSRANPGSDLFCLEVSAMEHSPDAAVKRFRELAAQAGLAMFSGGEAAHPSG